MSELTPKQLQRRRKRLIQQATKLSRQAERASTIYRECRLYRKANAIFENLPPETPDEHHSA